MKKVSADERKAQSEGKTVPTVMGVQVFEEPVFPLLETIVEETGTAYRVTWKNHYWFTKGDSAQQVIERLAREGVTGIRIRKATENEISSI